jgi:tRNA (guanosine-2'-O-)-methyltransferase
VNIQYKKELIEFLSLRITQARRLKMDEVILNRTRHVTLVLENIFQDHNASAIMRSAECLGMQDIHLVQDKCKFSVSDGVALGSSNWVDIHRYASTPQAFDQLKAQGYKMVVTSPNTDMMLEDLPIDQKIALVFGTEREGVTEYAQKHADALIKIPMYGFTQSYNVSISVALCLYHIIPKVHTSSIPWQISEEERIDIMLSWIRRSIRGWEAFERMFAQMQANQK